MKYYFKSPEEVQDLIKEQGTKSAKKRNRGRIILIIDVAILILIAGILYYKGFFIKKDAASLSTVSIQNLEFSASITGISSEDKSVEFYLNVKNNSNKQLTFPSKKDSLIIKSMFVEFNSNDFLLHTSPAIIKSSLIGPGQTVIYNFKAAFPLKARKGRKRVKPVIRIELDRNVFKLRFPEIMIK